MLKAANAYLSTQINTTSQGEVLLMLYDGAIKFLTQAKEQMRSRDYAQKGILISRALDVIAELDGSLNAEKGGELAQNLHKLYFYCNTRLLRANLEMSEDYVDEVIKIMEAMRTAFREITQAEGMVAEGQARSTAEAAAKGRAARPEEARAALQATVEQTYRPTPRAAAPEPAVSQDEAPGDADADSPVLLQDIPTRSANLRMVAKLKAYNRAGS